MTIQSILVLLGFVGACALAASMGAVFRPGIWYERLVKPPWRPPNSVFAPVWAVLYLSIAVSGWLVWRASGFTGATLPLVVYGIQLTLNAAWPAIFFGLHRIGLALVEIVLLWVAIVTTIALFFPVQHTASLLLLPYLAWVSFAGALNFAVWRLNHASTP